MSVTETKAFSTVTVYVALTSPPVALAPFIVAVTFTVPSFFPVNSTCFLSSDIDFKSASSSLSQLQLIC